MSTIYPVINKTVVAADFGYLFRPSKDNELDALEIKSNGDTVVLTQLTYRATGPMAVITPSGTVFRGLAAKDSENLHIEHVATPHDISGLKAALTDAAARIPGTTLAGKLAAICERLGKVA